MALCNTCMFYSEIYDKLNMDFNDVGDENNHYCMMYKDTIPGGIIEGEKDCPYYTEKP